MSVDRTLTKAQRNVVFRKVVALNIDPGEFEWVVEKSQDVSDSLVSLLRHPVTGFYFRFDILSFRYSPSVGGRAEVPVIHAAGWDWEDTDRRLDAWLKALKPEIEEPDLWDAVKKEKLLYQAATAGTTENRPFTISEQAFISEQLKSIQASIVTAHQLSEEQIARLEAGIKYLKESSERMGRKDWINVAIGTVVSVAVGAAFAPEAAGDLLQMVTSSFQTLLSVATKMLASG